MSQKTIFPFLKNSLIITFFGLVFMHKMHAQVLFPIKDKFDTIYGVLPKQIISFVPKVEIYDVQNVASEQVDDLIIYNYSEANNLPANTVNDLAKDRKGFLWLASNKGLIKFDGNTFYKIQLPDTLINSDIKCVEVDKKGNVWFSIFEGQLFMYDHHKVYVMNDIALDLKIRELFCSLDSTLWIGCDNGFVKFKNNLFLKFTFNFKKEKTDKVYAVLNISEDYNRNMWITSFGKNILKIKNNTIKEYNFTQDKDTLDHYNNHKAVKAVHFMNGKTIICVRPNKVYEIYNDSVLNKLCYQTTKFFNNGLINSDMIYWDNHFYLSTNFGVLKFDKEFKTGDYVSSAFLLKQKTRKVICDDNSMYVAKLNGLSIIKKSTIKKYPSASNSISAIRSSGDDVFFASRIQLFQMTDSIREIPTRQPAISQNDIFISDVYKNKLLFGSKFSTFALTNYKGDSIKYYSDSTTKRGFNYAILPPGAVNDVIYINDSIVITFGYYVISRVNVNSNKTIRIEKNKLEINKAAKIPNSNTIIFSTTNDIYSYNINTGEIKKILHKYAIGSFVYYSNYIYVYTPFDGYIHKVDYKTGEIVKSQKNGLLKKYTNSDMCMVENKIFIATNGGVFYFNINDFNNELLNLNNIKISNTQNGNDIGLYNLHYNSTRKILYFSYENNLYSIPYSKLFFNQALLPLISRVEVNERIYFDIIGAKSIERISLPYDSSEFKIYLSAISPYFEKSSRYLYILEGFDKSWKEISKTNLVPYSNLAFGTYVFRYKAVTDCGVESGEKTFKIVIKPPFWRTYWFYTLVVFLLIIFVFLVIKIREKNLQQEKMILEQKVLERTEEVVKQKTEIEKKSTIITDNIEYAKNIQLAILPSHDYISKHFKEYFVLNKPKDTVSGDFYWLHEDENKAILAVADCTGHGVSGAFVSLMGQNLLTASISEIADSSPAQILNILNNKLLNTTKHNTEAVKYGLDIALISIDKETNLLEFAGARNSVFIFRQQELIILEGNKFSIDNIKSNNEIDFANYSFKLEKGDMLYMFSDGYKDQIGGTERKKFFSKNFNNLLQSISLEPIEEQKLILEETLTKWIGKGNQTDDILIFGIRI